MDVFVPLAPFIMTVLIVVTVFYFSSRNRREIQETLREALRNGQTLDPETIKALGMPQKKDGNGDLKAGLILIAVAMALIVMGWMMASTIPQSVGEPDPIIMMTGIAAFPGFIGLVLTGFGLARMNRKGKTGGQG